MSDLLSSLAEKIKEFEQAHGTRPNAILMTQCAVERITEIQDLLEGIDCIIPVPDYSAVGRYYDLPLPVLLPKIATLSQRRKLTTLRGKDF